MYVLPEISYHVSMHNTTKYLVGAGCLLVLIGFAWPWLLTFFTKYLPLGKLPGDIKVEGKHGSFYFPVVTCLLVSLVLSLLSRLFKW